MTTQRRFQAALLDPAAARPENLSDGQGHRAGRRFDVYRNNVAVSLTEGLEAAFPVIRKLVGDKNFKTLAGAFLRQHPPSSPLLMFYGSEMPEFLKNYAPTSQIGYLPDVAHLEIALRQSYHAGENTSIDVAFFQSLSPDRLMASRLALAPSLRLVRSAWPIHTIWRFNVEDDAPKPAMAPEDIVVLRYEFDPQPRLLPVGGGEFLGAILAGYTFGAALDAALAKTPDFNLSEILTLLLSASALVSIEE